MLDLDNIESDEYSRRLKLLDGLKSALRTQSLSFVERFIELDGLTRLLEFLLSMNTGKVDSILPVKIVITEGRAESGQPCVKVDGLE